MNPYRSEITSHFLSLYRKLPKEIRDRSRRVFHVWRETPDLPGLHFKRLAVADSLYSVRIDRDYRVVGKLQGDLIRWDFIGNHNAYMRYLAKA